jgi:hypothetical protein
MESLIWLTFRYGASDQRDKYYALISLERELSMTTLLGPKLLVPDYGKPLREVARDFTPYSIQTADSLLLLSLINPSDFELKQRFESRTPSWVYVPSNELYNLRFGEQYILSGWPYAIKRKAHAVVSDLGVRIQPSEDPDVLVLGGIRDDELIDVPAREYGKPRLLDWCEQGYRRCNLIDTISVKNYLAKVFAQSQRSMISKAET